MQNWECHSGQILTLCCLSFCGCSCVCVTGPNSLLTLCETHPLP